MRVLGWVFYGILAFLAVAIALFGFRFLTFNPQVLFSDLRQNLLDHPVPFYVHTTLAPLALIVGVWQFLPITRRTMWHRWAGRLYVLSALVASFAGLMVAFTSAAGILPGIAFAILAVLSLGSTLVGYAKVRAGRYREHRQWMIRSYALIASGITLRIILPVAMVAGFDFKTSYTIAAWGCWTVNLVIAEFLVRRSKPPADLPADRAPRSEAVTV